MILLDRRMNKSRLEDGERINNNISSFITFTLPFVLNIDQYRLDCFYLSYELYQLSVSILSSGSFKSVPVRGKKIS